MSPTHKTYIILLTHGPWFSYPQTSGKMFVISCYQLLIKSDKYMQYYVFFTNSPQYKNANIANFVLALPLERCRTKEVCNLEKYSFDILCYHMLQMKKTANIWEYKVGNNVIISNFVRLWKTQVILHTVFPIYLLN